MLNVIEVLAKSPDGFDQAAYAAVTMDSKTVRTIKSVNIKEMNAQVEIQSFTGPGKTVFAGHNAFVRSCECN